MYLTKAKLIEFYPPADEMTEAHVDTFLPRANSYANGVIGGKLDDEYVDDHLLTAVALAFEIMTKGDTAQVDPNNGNITRAAPEGHFVPRRAEYNPLETVKAMLIPYKEIYAGLNNSSDDRGFMFV